ncbi:MAG: MarR family transcriptional regulator [Hyphomonadaceae bacterium]|nr:MarR family transcriptional regulator [Hyphomonadaceae bacterium]
MAIARPIHRRLFAVFDRAHGRLSRQASKALSLASVKPAQATALLYLGYHNGCQLTELADGVGSNNAAVTGLVSRMEKSGLVVRRSLQSDGRGKTVHLTEKGLQTRERVMQILRALDERISTHFTDTELETINRFLNIASDIRIE